ncbi:helix-hairpin-helix domain-containing protein [Micromonospora sp. WMMA1923]|uniref:helix-hairpin-helix domain-containing protein n=1 Tax=Micromonospora sp. WMMA1923 TaxID=3404125 RepID=UPI003B94B8A6
MSDDEETMARRRLWWLFGAVDAEPAAGLTPPGWPEHPPPGAVGATPSGRPVPGLSLGEPPPLGPSGRSVAHPVADDDPVGPSPRPAAYPVVHPTGVADDDPAGDDDETAELPAPSRLPGPDAFDPGRRGVRVLAVVGVLVVLGAGFWAWRSRPQAEPVPVVTTAASAEAAPVAEPDGPPAGELVVAVAGRVRRPGLVRVPAGARVADAVEAAGGVLPGVDLALLNPARKVADGELVLVGVTPPPGQPAPAGAAGQPGGAAPGDAAPGAPVNLNTATLAQLDSLPGVGPVLAQRILAHREEHGPFRTVGDLRQVDGIGDARFEQLKELVTV